jgi:hypothetical protein
MFCKQEKVLCAVQFGVAMCEAGGRKEEGMAAGFDESQSVVDKGGQRRQNA